MNAERAKRPAGAGPFGMSHWLVLAVLALVAAITYLPFVGLAPLQDDYGHIWLAERHGRPAGWDALLGDPLYRCRATSLLYTAATIALFGVSNTAFHLSAILLHVLNAWLVYALGRCRWIGWGVSAAAALVFAARERHHEAVIWYASIHELLAFAFVLLAVLAWVRWLEGGARWWVAAAGAAWVGALFSKESGVVLMLLLPLFALCYEGRRRAAAGALAVGVVSTAAYFLWAFGKRDEHLHFNDGTFVLGTHFLKTALNSAARGLWIWGGASLLAVWVWRKQVERRAVALALGWFLAGLGPYVFLTYMPRIPSRHHYLASAGMALVAGVGLWAVLARVKRPRLVAVALAALFLLHNWGYLWTYKKGQFEERAEMLEGLVRAVKDNPGQGVAVDCPEVLLHEARMAVHYRLGLDGDALVRRAEPGAAGVRYGCPAPRR